MRDPRRPLFHWHVGSHVGPELVIALFTRPCRYGRCAFCSLPSLAFGGELVSESDIEKQIDFAFSCYPRKQLARVAKLSLYTASSSLDPESLPTQSLLYLLRRVAQMPSLKVFSLETRPEHVQTGALRMIQGVLGERVRVEVAVGYETHNPVLRNRVLRKGITGRGLQRLLRLLARNHSCLKAYLMLKPHHSLSEEEGVREAIRGLDELAALGAEYGVPVFVHLNPTYVAQGCRLADEMLKNGYKPPEIASIIEVLGAASKRHLPIFVGLNDEGLAVSEGTFRSSGFDRGRAIEALRAFNEHQSMARLLAEAGQKTTPFEVLSG